MALSNFERLIQLADEVFSVKSDPSQLDVNPEVLERLHQLQPATVSAHDDGNGPVAWGLLIPTTIGLMKRFLKSEINLGKRTLRTNPAECQLRRHLPLFGPGSGRIPPERDYQTTGACGY